MSCIQDVNLRRAIPTGWLGVDIVLQTRFYAEAQNVGFSRAKAGIPDPAMKTGDLGYETRPLVSAGFNDDPRSGIMDAPLTMVISGTWVKVHVWYDYEWGYACRSGDVTRMIAAGLT